MKRGDIRWAEMREPRASEPGYRRPVLVVQSDAFKESRISTVTAAAIACSLRLADAPGNVALSKRESGLPRDSVVNVSQVVTMDREFLTARVGTVPPEVIDAIARGLRLVLSL